MTSKRKLGKSWSWPFKQYLQREKQKAAWKNFIKVWNKKLKKKTNNKTKQNKTNNKTKQNKTTTKQQQNNNNKTTTKQQQNNNKTTKSL